MMLATKNIFRLNGRLATSLFLGGIFALMFSCIQEPCSNVKENAKIIESSNTQPSLVRLQCPTTQPTSNGTRRVLLQCNVRAGAIGTTESELEIKLTNHDDHSWTLSNWNTIKEFPTWLLKDGQEVALTDFGKAHEPRWQPPLTAHPQAYISDRPLILEPGESATFSIDLMQLFEIHAGEMYDVIVQTKLVDRATYKNVSPVGYTSFSSKKRTGDSTNP